MSLAINLLFIGHRRLAVALTEINIYIDDVNWVVATRKCEEFGELLTAHLHADKTFVLEKLTDLGETCESDGSLLQTKGSALDDHHQRLVRAVAARNNAEALLTLPPLSDALKEWAQERMAALACIEGAHGDVSTELARALGPPPTGHPSH